MTRTFGRSAAAARPAGPTAKMISAKTRTRTIGASATCTPDQTRAPLLRLRQLLLNARGDGFSDQLVAGGLEVHVVVAADLVANGQHDRVQVVDRDAVLLHHLDGDFVASRDAV